jgi:hypothetical protein
LAVELERLVQDAGFFPTVEDPVGPRIEGEDAGPDRIPSLVHQVDTIAMAGDPDARDLTCVYSGAFEGLVDRTPASLPNPVHVLLDPARVGALLGVVDRPSAPLAPLLVEDDRFGDREAAVDA